MRPDAPKPAENGVPLIDKRVATPPVIPAAIMTGTNNKGLRNILAI